MRGRLLFIIVYFITTGISVTAQSIITYAGTGISGYSGDGGPATAAQLRPISMAIAPNGSMYIANSLSTHAIRKIDPVTGIITTIAGGLISGYSGDGGPAAAARLEDPWAIACDPAGNIYFADQQGCALRRIDAVTGIITTLGGGPFLSGFTGYSGDGGPVSAAKWNTMIDMVFDNSGTNLYFSDFGNMVIRKINIATGIITTVIGSGVRGFAGDGGPATAAAFDCIYGFDFDNAGNIYINDATNVRIRKVDAVTGIITTIAGNGTVSNTGDGGPASAATIWGAYGVRTDNAGNVYIANNISVRKIDAATGIISRYAGNGITAGYSGDFGPPLSAAISAYSLAIDASNDLYMAESFQYGLIRKITCLNVAATQQPTDSIVCNSGNARFKITAPYNPNYRWQVNTGAGWNNITNNATYAGATTNTLDIAGATTAMNGYLYRCNTTNACRSEFSSPATLIVNTLATPGLTINTTATTICSGANSLFTAVPVNGGTVPVYQWKKNGTNVGINSSSYSDNTLNNGDIITCVLTSNGTCITSPTATSNAVTMIVTPTVAPTLSIAGSVNNICAGTNVNFTSTTGNGGSSPQYQWKKNGVNAGTNTSTYSDNTLNNGDIISCILTSNAACATTATANSNTIGMAVNPLLTPTVSIAGSATTICTGTTVNFASTIGNGGPSPVYQWRKNGTPVGTNSPTYSDNTLNNGDQVTCALTGSLTCVTSATAASNVITMNVNALLTPTISISTASNAICDDAAAGFTSVITNGGSTPSYQWKKNNINVGTNSNTYTDNTLNNGDIISCSLSSDADCLVTATGSSNNISMTVYPKPGEFLPDDTSFCNYDSLTLTSSSPFNTYTWSNGANSPSITINQPGTYWLDVTDNNNCLGRSTVLVTWKECREGLFIPTAFTPNNDGLNDTFKPMVFGAVKKYEFQVYNQWGNMVFSTKDLSKGWNGIFKGSVQQMNVFIWVCSYQLDGKPAKTEKGTVLLIQ